MGSLDTQFVQAGATGRKGWKARVTARQQQAILDASGGERLGKWVDECEAYVCTGDASYLSPDAKSAIDRIVTGAKNSLDESQGKRIWPRKVASVLLANS